MPCKALVRWSINVGGGFGLYHFGQKGSYVFPQPCSCFLG